MKDKKKPFPKNNAAKTERRPNHEAPISSEGNRNEIHTRRKNETEAISGTHPGETEPPKSARKNTAAAEPITEPDSRDVNSEKTGYRSPLSARIDEKAMMYASKHTICSGGMKYRTQWIEFSYCNPIDIHFSLLLYPKSPYFSICFRKFVYFC